MVNGPFVIEAEALGCRYPFSKEEYSQHDACNEPIYAESNSEVSLPEHNARRCKVANCHVHGLIFVAGILTPATDGPSSFPHFVQWIEKTLG